MAKAYQCDCCKKPFVGSPINMSLIPEYSDVCVDCRDFICCVYGKAKDANKAYLDELEKKYSKAARNITHLITWMESCYLQNKKKFREHFGTLAEEHLQEAMDDFNAP